MEPVNSHGAPADVSFDGGALDCGNGLLLLIRRHIDPLSRGQRLEIRSTESSVEEDLPAWCRLTGHPLLSWTRVGNVRSYLVEKGGSSERGAPRAPIVAAQVDDRSPPLRKVAPSIAPWSIMGIGSWPRPRWLLRALHERLEGRLGEPEFAEMADDAVRLALQAQLSAGVDVVTDGEQRRDAYASFVGGILDNAQLIPLTDLTAMVDDPEEFARELRALDVPAHEVRHPVPIGRLRRSRPLAAGEVAFVRQHTQLPVKASLPGPYLLSRTLWLHCLRNNAYRSRDALAADLVDILRAELSDLLAVGTSLVQFDEPVLTEVVFSGRSSNRSFMCGALSEKGDPEVELAFARELLTAVVQGFPTSAIALHVCRGNWTRDESALLSGSYEALAPFLSSVPVGTLFLETSTPRAGEISALRSLPPSVRVGLGVVNPRSDRIDPPEEILARVSAARAALGEREYLLTPDCGFATFADNPVASSEVAVAKLRALANARDRLRDPGPN